MKHFIQLTITIILSALLITFSSCSKSTSETTAAGPSDTAFYGGFSSSEEWGEHMVTIAGCHDCHTPKKFNEHGMFLDSSRLLSGHPASEPHVAFEYQEAQKKGLAVTSSLTSWVGPWGVSYSANLTSDPTGIGNWSEEQFMYAIRHGKYKGMEKSRGLLPPMPWEFYRHMTDAELKAIFAYLKTTTPIENVVPAPIMAAAPPAM